MQRINVLLILEALERAKSQKVGAEESHSELDHGITWALEPADRLDPLNSRWVHN